VDIQEIETANAKVPLYFTKRNTKISNPLMFKKSASPEKKTQLGGEIAGQFSRAEEMTEKQCITTEQHC